MVGTNIFYKKKQILIQTTLDGTGSILLFTIHNSDSVIIKKYYTLRSRNGGMYIISEQCSCDMCI